MPPHCPASPPAPLSTPLSRSPPSLGPLSPQQTQRSPNSQALGLRPPLQFPASQPTASWQPPPRSPPPCCMLPWDVLFHPEEQMSLILSPWGCRVSIARVLGVLRLSGTSQCLLQPDPFQRCTGDAGGPTLQFQLWIPYIFGIISATLLAHGPTCLSAAPCEQGLLLPWSHRLHREVGDHICALCHHEVPGAPPGCCGPRESTDVHERLRHLASPPDLGSRGRRGGAANAPRPGPARRVPPFIPPPRPCCSPSPSHPSRFAPRGQVPTHG